MKNYAWQNATPVYLVEIPRKFISPPLTLHGHTSRKLKHKSGKYHQLYGMHAHVRGGGYLTRGAANLHFTPGQSTYYMRCLSRVSGLFTNHPNNAQTQRYSTSLKKFQHR